MISCTMAGFVFSRRLTERLELIREIQGLLMELDNEIRYMGRPVGQALLSLSRGRNTGLAQFLQRVCKMHRDDGITIEAAWQKNLDSFRGQWPLRPEEWELLLSIGEMLGKTDRAGQSSFIKMMLEKFSLQEKKADEDRALKEKLYKNLGVLCGLALVLVLV